MSHKTRMIAKISQEWPSSDIRWLALEPDDNTGGWFLFGLKVLSEPSEFDSWHETRLGALKEAESQWGVHECDWHSIDPIAGSR